MQATLIFNENAGNTRAYKVEELLNGLREAGYDPKCRETSTTAEIAPILDETTGLVVSAGGDGSAREVILRLIGRDDIFFTPLPMGTANNICKTLGIEGDPLELIRGLRSPRLFEFDVGKIAAPWGEGYFIEGAGIGFFAEILATYEPDKGKSVLRSVKSLVEILQNGFAREATIHMPNEDIHGEFLLVEALNMNAIGPRLKFAPDADPGDGLLNIVCIREDKKESYINYLTSLLNEELYELDSVEIYKASWCDISWQGFPVHLDAEIHPPNFIYRKEKEDESGYGLRPYPDLPESAVLHFENLPKRIRAYIPQLEDEDKAEPFPFD
jgi:diacylglycerol kinase family enzyme